MEKALDKLNAIIAITNYSTSIALQKWKEDYIQEVHTNLGVSNIVMDKISEEEIRKMLSINLSRELVKYLPLASGVSTGSIGWERIYRMSTFVLIDKSKLPENK